MTHAATSPARTNSAAPTPEPQVLVWDGAVRAFHWLLVAAVAVALATGLLAPRRWHDVHVWAGTVAVALVACRLVWGFLGPTYARFSSFPPDPRRAWCYLAALRRGEEPWFVGHNPLGALMIATLVGAVAVLGATGLLALGGVSKEGPLAAFASFRTGAAALGVHAWIAYAVAGLVVLHILGTLREGPVLLRSMLSGRKPVRPAAVTAPATAARPKAAIGTVVGTGAATIVAVLVLSARDVPDVPTAPLDPFYAKECGACHSPHHPSVAPARTWSAVMAGLASHFGDDASLRDADARRIADYLAANSAERFDTAAANLMRTPAADAPLRITATAGWRRLHADVPEADFQRRPVGGRLNCSACHADAESGRFAARAISIPSNPVETRSP